MQLTAAAVTPPAEHAARRPAGRRTRPQLMPTLCRLILGDDRMRGFILITVIMAIVLSESAPAEVVEVPLPDLQGRYFTEDTVTRYASFQMDAAPLSIAGVSIRISGTHIVGEIMCEAEAGFMVPQPYSVAFRASMPDAVNGDLWTASQISPLASGDFEITIPFGQIYGWYVTWDFLLAGYGEVRLDGPGAGFILTCSPTIWPDATVTEAVLLVDGEFPVATKGSSWGSIKALFR